MNLGSDVASTPGWYGKLPSLGDFASRRLEADFIEPWDVWLGEGLQAQRAELGEAWLDAYLDTPPWRFLLAPGVLASVAPGSVFAGVLVPSVDRVGRHFPLTLAASLAQAPRSAAEFDTLLAWLHRLEDAALDALQGDWSIEDLERALHGLAPPPVEAAASAEDRLGTVRRSLAAAVASRGGFVDIATIASRAELAAVFSSSPGARSGPADVAGPTWHGMAFWIADSPGRPQLLVSDGLPGHAAFVRMFSGGGGAGSGAAARPSPVDPGAAFAVIAAPAELSSPAVEPQLAAGETDLLGLFDAGALTASGGACDPGAAPGDDILAMFGVGDRALEAPVAAAAGHDDVLGLFADPLAPGETQAAPASAELPEARPGEPDILDLFGGPPAQPVTGKAP
ncbi:MAG: type VI secretion system-associated protein TagF [Caldimonas sp.]